MSSSPKVTENVTMVPDMSPSVIPATLTVLVIFLLSMDMRYGLGKFYAVEFSVDLTIDLTIVTMQ